MSDAQTTLGAFDGEDIGAADHDATDAAETADHADLDDADDLRGYVKSNMENIDKLLTVINSVSDDVDALEEVATLALDSGETTDSADPEPDIDPNDARMFR